MTTAMKKEPAWANIDAQNIKRLLIFQDNRGILCNLLRNIKKYPSL
jgi:hypothetical protein